jgi:hypothetical protein
MRIAYLLLVLALAGLPLRAAAGENPQAVFYQLGNWQLYGAGPHYFDLGLGVFDARESSGGQASAAARLELRLGKKLGFVGPAVGLLANTDGGWFGYGGLYADLAYKRLIITPLLSAGAFDEGSGKDLGGTFQFRPALSLAWQFANGARLGLQAAHISNADLHSINPGEEEFLVTLAWPF